MTPAQAKFKYWPAWNRAARAQGWRTEAGVLIATGPQRWGGNDTSELLDGIWALARRLAETSGEKLGPDHFRHACHMAAVGRDKSSADLTNLEFDRVLVCFALMADPDNLDAMISWSHPEIEVRKRMLWWLDNRCVGGYARSLCRQKFGTDDWHSLNDEQVRELHMTLKNRPASWKSRAALQRQAA